MGVMVECTPDGTVLRVATRNTKRPGGGGVSPVIIPPSRPGSTGEPCRPSLTIIISRGVSSASWNLYFPAWMRCEMPKTPTH